jgi:hypothetical protein
MPHSELPNKSSLNAARQDQGSNPTDETIPLFYPSSSRLIDWFPFSLSHGLSIIQLASTEPRLEVTHEVISFYSGAIYDLCRRCLLSPC